MKLLMRVPQELIKPGDGSSSQDLPCVQVKGRTGLPV
jgi:hypothetical protein